LVCFYEKLIGNEVNTNQLRITKKSKIMYTTRSYNYVLPSSPRIDKPQCTYSVFFPDRFGQKRMKSEVFKF